VYSKDLGEFSVLQKGDIYYITGLFLWNSRYVIWDQYALHNGMQNKCDKNIPPYASNEFLETATAYINGFRKYPSNDLSTTNINPKLEKAKGQYPQELLWFFYNIKNQNTHVWGPVISVNRYFDKAPIDSYAKILENGITTALKTMRPVKFSRCMNGSYGNPPRIPKINPPYNVDYNY
jgi:hypothetical protein